MTDAEKRGKVIRGLECCIAYDYLCNDCPYADDGGAEDGCYSDELKTDALALLKAQEPVEPQEKREGDYRNLYCGACGRGIVGYVEHTTGKHSKLSDYCRKCGQKVKWG